MRLASCYDLILGAQTGGFVSTGRYAPAADPTVNEYVLFFKPELTALERGAFERVADLVQQCLESFDQSIVLVSALGSHYIGNFRIAEQHYGVINRVSQTGERALQPETMQRLAEVRSGVDAETLGGHQVLARYPFFTPAALAVLSDNLQSVRLAPGTYCVTAVIRGRRTAILNGFHPEQLEHYTKPGAAILALVVRGTRSWASIRRELTGATDPQRAQAGSIRALLLARRAELGLEEVSSGRNGIHLSAGPVEGMVEVCRYACDLGKKEERVRVEDTTLAKLLQTSGVPGQAIHAAAANSTVTASGTATSVFDLTEELDARAVSATLLGVEFPEQ